MHLILFTSQRDHVWLEKGRGWKRDALRKEEKEKCRYCNCPGPVITLKYSYSYALGSISMVCELQ